MSDDIYEVYAIRHACHEGRAAATMFLRPDPHETTRAHDFFIWVLKSPKRTIVVDTGFDTAVSTKRGREIIRPIAEGLKALGVQPDKVEDVIVTHMHWDHAGNYELFPRARYHLQDCEVNYMTGRCMCHGELRVPFEIEDIVAMVRKVFAGRVEFHDGDETCFPGVTLHKIGGHSRGLQCVTVNTRRGPVVLASDATHLWEHIETGRVFPLTYSVGEVLEGYSKMKKLAPTMNHIIPGHDPLVTKRFPAAGPGMENWIVRLDVEPKPA